MAMAIGLWGEPSVGKTAAQPLAAAAHGKPWENWAKSRQLTVIGRSFTSRFRGSKG